MRVQVDYLYLINKVSHTILRLLDGTDPGLHGHELLALACVHLLKEEGIWLLGRFGDYNVACALIEGRSLVASFDIKRICVACRDTRVVSILGNAYSAEEEAPQPII